MGRVKLTVRLIQSTWLNWLSHDPTRIGAALAYYTLLSLAPLVIFSIAAVGVFFGGPATEHRLLQEIQELVGGEVAQVIQAMAKQAGRPAPGIFASILGIFILAVGASGVFLELRSALNTMWDLKIPGRSGIWEIVQDRLFSIGIVLAVGFLLVVSLLVSTAIAVLGKLFGNYLPLPVPLLNAINSILSFVGITILFALVLRYVPDAKLRWRNVWVGGSVSAFLFTVGKFLLGLYLGHAAVGSFYGAGGSTVVVTVWAYYSAQLFLFGAEFTRVYEQHRDAFDSA